MSDTTCLDCTELVYLVVVGDEARCPECDKRYEIVERHGYERFVPVDDDESLQKQRLARIREWAERENPRFGDTFEVAADT